MSLFNCRREHVLSPGLNGHDEHPFFLTIFCHGNKIRRSGAMLCILDAVYKPVRIDRIEPEVAVGALLPAGAMSSPKTVR